MSLNGLDTQEKRPMVSIGMTVYNQEKYVAHAIESILMQRVDFDIEIVIAEDCSTDRSREIVIEYAERYPQVIRTILQEHNVGLKQQSICLKKACRGKYRAQLEGDDYWIDPFKLKKQVDFLENNPDFVAVSGRIKCVDPNDRNCKFPYGELTNIYFFDGEYTAKDFEKWLLPSHTGALLYRNVYYNCDQERFERYEAVDVMGDRKTALMLLGHGRMMVLPDTVSVRRIDLGSAANFTSNSVKIKPYATICTWMDRLEVMADDMYGISIDMKLEKRKQWIYALKNFARFPNRDNLAGIKAIYRMSREKHVLVSLANAGLREKMKKKIKKEGFFHALGGMVKFCFKSLGKITKSRKTDRKASERVISGDAQK